MNFRVMVGEEQNSLPSKEESVSFNHAAAAIQIWSHLGLGLGASRGPQAASFRPGGFKHLES